MTRIFGGVAFRVLAPPLVCVAALGVAACTVAEGDGGEARPSGPGPAELTAIAAKQTARAAAGVAEPVPVDPSAPVISGPVRSCGYNQTVHLSREELIARIDEESKAAEARWAELERSQGAAIANEARRRFLEEQERLKADIPPGGKTLSIGMVEVGPTLTKC